MGRWGLGLERTIRNWCLWNWRMLTLVKYLKLSCMVCNQRVSSLGQDDYLWYSWHISCWFHRYLMLSSWLSSSRGGNDTFHNQVLEAFHILPSHSFSCCNCWVLIIRCWQYACSSSHHFLICSFSSREFTLQLAPFLDFRNLQPKT